MRSLRQLIHDDWPAFVAAGVVCAVIALMVVGIVISERPG